MSIVSSRQKSDLHDPLLCMLSYHIIQLVKLHCKCTTVGHSNVWGKKRKQSEQCCLWTKNYQGMLVSIKRAALLRAGWVKDSMIKAGKGIKWDGSVFTINLISLCCVHTHTHRIEMPQYILSQMTAAAYTHLWACTMRAAVGSHWLWWHSTHIQQSR